MSAAYQKPAAGEGVSKSRTSILSDLPIQDNQRTVAVCNYQYQVQHCSWQTHNHECSNPVSPASLLQAVDLEVVDLLATTTTMTVGVKAIWRYQIGGTQGRYT
jgi:hypothetical protein